MWIICPSCKAKTKVSGILSFKCTSCGKKFSKPVPLNAKDAEIFILMGILAIIGGAVSHAIEGGILEKLSPFIFILGTVTFLKGVFQRLFADKSVLVIDEIEKSSVVREYPVVVLELEQIADSNQAINLEQAEAKPYYNLGIAYAKKKRYHESIETFKNAIKLNPAYAEAHGGLGLVFEKLNHRQEAIQAYLQAIKLKPDYAVMHYNLGIAYFKSGRYQEAIEAYKKAIELNPKSPEVHANLGNAYLKMGNKDGALEEYKLLKTMDSEWADKLLRSIGDVIK